MITDITNILKKLDITTTGHYDNQFYVIDLQDSDDYARAYTKLNANAINTEYPNFGTNSSNNTVKITNYFELDLDNISYNIFLIADFANNKYIIKIGEK